MVYELAKKMEAGIAAESIVEQGALALILRCAKLRLMNTATILIIEDDDLQYEIYEEALSKYNLVRVLNGTEALARIPQQLPDAVVLDHVLADGELGLDFLPELKELLPFVPIIVVSGALEVHQQMEALQGPRRAHYCDQAVDVIRSKRVATALKNAAKGGCEAIRSATIAPH